MNYQLKALVLEGFSDNISLHQLMYWMQLTTTIIQVLKDVLNHVFSYLLGN